MLFDILTIIGLLTLYVSYAAMGIGLFYYTYKKIGFNHLTVILTLPLFIIHWPIAVIVLIYMGFLPRQPWFKKEQEPEYNYPGYRN